MKIKEPETLEDLLGEEPALSEELPEIPMSQEDMLEKIRILEKKIDLSLGLPFLYGFPHYKWSWEFYSSTKKMCLLTAANQSGKSVTNIRKCLNWATNVEMWPKLWNTKPQQFWYFYPSDQMVQIEFETKWKTLLPTGAYQHEKELAGLPNPYHWKIIRFQGRVAGIKFPNTGVSVYFRTYSQKVSNLQASTVHAMFCDEELPTDYYDELMFRLTATGGYFNAVFTATLGQEFWRQVMEPAAHEAELLPQASKWTVSLYDCLQFVDGTNSHWSVDRIEDVISKCSTHDEVLRRVFGKFIRDSQGLKYPQFDLKKNFGPNPPKTLPSNWLIYAGADTGSGGVTKGKKKAGHLSALCFVAVHPNMKKARVFKAWRGDGITTTAGDVVLKYIEMSKNLSITQSRYDYANADFKNIAASMSVPFLPANKSHDKGEYIINILLKHQMIELDACDAEVYKLGVELSSVRKDIAKNSQLDDLSDAFRYAVTEIPWDFSGISIDLKELGVEEPVIEETDEQLKAKDRAMKLEWRRNGFPPDDPGRIKDEQANLQDEYNEFNELADPQF